MRKTSKKLSNGLRPEYDFTSMKGGIRGKYVKRFNKSSNIVVLEPEVAEAFPNDDAVNQALRGVLNIARAIRPRGELKNKVFSRKKSGRK